MELTPRQQTFLDKLFDLYREFDGPVHYSLVAERLGVNRFSAYDMLRLLEAKGVVASSYLLKDEHAGPGRTMVVFYPTHKASRFLTQLRQEVFNTDEWYRTKERLLSQLRQTAETGYNKPLRDILARLPDVKTPLVYCTEMLGVLLLNLAQASQKAGEILSYHTVANLVADDQVGLGTLAGFSLGTSLSNHSNDPSLIDKLTRHTREFQAQLNELSEDSVNRLNAFVHDALKVFEPAR